MKLVVTGGSGFLGAYVLREAARRGHETVALARSEAAAAAVAALGATPVGGNLDDGRSLDHAFSPPGPGGYGSLPRSRSARRRWTGRSCGRR